MTAGILALFFLFFPVWGCRGRRSSILSSDRLPLSAISSNGAGDSKAQEEGNSTDSSASVSSKPLTNELKGNLQGQSHSRQWLPHNVSFLLGIIVSPLVGVTGSDLAIVHSLCIPASFI